MQFEKLYGAQAADASARLAPVLLRNELREKIIALIKQNDGLTITNVSKLLRIHPSTSSKYLAVMEAERSVVCKHIGMAKVFTVRSVII